MMGNEGIKNIEKATVTLGLLEANGRIDGLEGKNREKGWSDLCKEKIWQGRGSFEKFDQG